MIDMPDRPDVAMRLRPFKLRLRHGFRLPVPANTFDRYPEYDPINRPAGLERVMGIEPM
jgi:hypothetical protein